MGTGTIGQGKLKAFRRERGLTMEEAAALIVVAGEAVNKTTWHGWESKGKIPKPLFMLELERAVGTEPNDFYRRPDAGELQHVDRRPLQPAML
jgi:transcriptional regulator with XRE-family HTH domain